MSKFRVWEKRDRGKERLAGAVTMRSRLERMLILIYNRKTGPADQILRCQLG